MWTDIMVIFILTGETQDSQVCSPSYFKSYFASPNCFTSRYLYIFIPLFHLTMLENFEMFHVLFLYFCFSLSSEHNNVACPTTASVQEPNTSLAELTSRKKNRRKPKRKGKRKLEKKEEKQRQRHRMPSGVPEQESGCSLVQIPVRTSHLIESLNLWINNPVL